MEASRSEKMQLKVRARWFGVALFLALSLIIALSSESYANTSTPVPVKLVVLDVIGSPRWGVGAMTRSLRRELGSDEITLVSNESFSKAQEELGLRGRSKFTQESLARACRAVQANYVLRVVVTKQGWLYRGRAHLIDCESIEIRMDFTSGYYKPDEEADDRGQRIGRTTRKKLKALSPPIEAIPDLEDSMVSEQSPAVSTPDDDKGEEETTTPDPFASAFESDVNEAEEFSVKELETPRAELVEGELEEAWQQSGRFESFYYGFLSNTDYLKGKDKSLLTLGFRGSIDGNLSSMFRLRFLPVIVVDVLNQRMFRTTVEEAFIEAAWEFLEFRLGWDALTWGSASTINIIDIINPRDYSRGILESEKLGQPMLSTRFLFGEHSFRLYYLSPFLNPVIPRVDSPFFPFPISTQSLALPQLDGNLQYNVILGAEAEEWTPQFAGRLALTLGDADLNASYFYGFTRFPLVSLSTLELFYPLIQQVSIDGQYLTQDILVKWEVAYSSFIETERFKQNMFPLPDSRVSWIVGVERTFEGVLGKTTITPVIELMGDSDSSWFTDVRPIDDAIRLFQNHLALALKWSFENEANSEVKLLDILNLTRPEEHVFTMEYSQRIFRSFTLVVGGRVVNAKADSKIVALEQLTGVYTKFRLNY